MPAVKRYIFLPPLIAVVLWNLFDYYHEVIGGVSPWRLGDWLINYESGFIRRGLIGAIFFLIFEDIDKIFIGIYLLQSACYLIILAYVAGRLKSNDFSKSDLLVIFSPAFIFLFNFYDPQGAFRKEILIYVAYIFLLHWRTRLGNNNWLIFISFFIYSVAVFSHELSSFFCIFFLRELWVAWRSNFLEEKRFYAYAAAFIFAGMLGIFAGLMYTGSATSYHLVCESLVKRGMSPATCIGTIEWLKFDASYGQKKVVEFFRYYILNYPFALFLALLPLFLEKWLTRNFVFAIISFFSIIPLFVIAVDWGRWVHIYITMLSMAFLSNEKRTDKNLSIFFLLGALLFSSSWSFRHCCSLGFEWGIWSR